MSSGAEESVKENGISPSSDPKDRRRIVVTADTPLGDVLDFMKLLWEVDHGLQQTSKRMALRMGVTGPQRLVLRIVSLFPGIAAGGLASALRLHPSSVTILLNRLERNGYLDRKPDPKDGRRVTLRVTARGRRVAKQTQNTVESVMKTVLASFPEEKLAAASEVLVAISRELARNNEDSPRGRKKD